MNKEIETVIAYKEKIEKIVLHAGEIIKDNSPAASAVHNKEGAANYVTDYDIQIQEYLIGELSRLFSGCSFYGEEDTDGNNHSTKSGFCFFIDPIDGTIKDCRDMAYRDKEEDVRNVLLAVKNALKVIWNIAASL